MERGVTHDLEFEAWANRIHPYTGDAAMDLAGYKKELTLEVLNEKGRIALRYFLFGCWVSEFTAVPQLDANANTVAIESIKIELEGWDYPQHIQGRLFAVIAHGDTEGAEGVRRSLADWLRATGLLPAGPLAEVDRYIGYWEPYATSHEALDRDAAIQEEVRNAARALLEAVLATRAAKQVAAGTRLTEPRRK